MSRLLLLTIIILALTLSACNVLLIPPDLAPPLPVINSVSTPLPLTEVSAALTFQPIVTATVTSDPYFVVDGNLGSDSNPGNLFQPWKSIDKALSSIVPGDTVYVRGGEYSITKGEWAFTNSGTQSQPITLSNYPGEQVIIKLTGTTIPLSCWYNAHFIRILGTDVSPRVLSNGVVSQKGIVFQGRENEQIYSIVAWGCDYWEVAGIDFIDNLSGIRTFKENDGQMVDKSSDYWYVHDNRVYRYYGESGMQFNGNHNRIMDNVFYKVTDENITPFGCQLLNLLGNNNIVRGNIISRQGSTANCTGILFEWDLSDSNIIEQNLIYDVPSGLDFQGGDNNIVRNNVIYNVDNIGETNAAILIWSYDDQTTWPCNDYRGSGSSSEILLPPDNPDHPDYQYYYPHDCHSKGNQIYNNTVYGFREGLRIYPIAGENTIIRNNVFAGWTRGGICYYKDSDKSCGRALPDNVIIDHNATEEPFGFVDLPKLDFHLTNDSPLIDSGFDLGWLVTKDFNGATRPQRGGYDRGAFELN